MTRTKRTVAAVPNPPPVFDVERQMLRLSGTYGAFLSQSGDDEPDIELKAQTVRGAVHELLEYYGHEPARGPGALRLEIHPYEGRWKIINDRTFDQLLSECAEPPVNGVQMMDPWMHLHVRVTIRRPSREVEGKAKRASRTKPGRKDEMWFDGRFAGLKRLGTACVPMDKETRAGNVMRRLYAHYGLKLDGNPDFRFKGFRFGPWDPNPCLMRLWKGKQRRTAGLSVPAKLRIFRYLNVRVRPGPPGCRCGYCKRIRRNKLRKAEEAAKELPPGPSALQS